MATKVHMEALSPTMEEGQLVRWLKKEGDAVSEGDVLAEIETDKATMELVARGSGVLRNITLAEGGTAPVGEVIAVIAAAGEDVASPVGGAVATAAAAGAPASAPRPAAAPAAGAASAPVASAAGATPASPAGATPAVEEEEEMTGASLERARDVQDDDGDGGGDGRVKASPLARRLASEAGIALQAVRGSGPGGRIVKRDIEAAARQAEPGAVAAALAKPVQPALRLADGPDVEDVPVSQLRKTIAKRLVTSIGPIPTFYLTIDVDVTRLLAARESVNERLEHQGVKTSINDFILKAVAVALARHPEVNAQWAETVIRRHHRVHVGVAVAIEDGLITPVIRDANLKGIIEIATEVKALAARAREKRLTPDEYTGATFSISNLGMFGIEEFTAIINPPEAGILAIGAVAERVVVEHGTMVVRPRMRMTMSCDHRVVDGATGARFLQTVRDHLEEPAMMLT